MKRLGRFAALVLLCAVLFAAPRAMKKAVVDVRERIRPQDTRWQGIISVGFVPTFSMDSADRWIRTCAAAFAEENSNVKLSLREMTKAGVQAGSAAQMLPDVLIFGAGVFHDTEHTALFAEEAQPVAAGAYALLGNRALLEKAGWQEKMSMQETLSLAQSGQLRIAVPQRDYADPLAALHRMGSTGDTAVEDLYARVWPDFALEEKYPLYVATQREILRMQTLRSAGRGFETVLLVPEAPLGGEQTLLCAAVRPELTARQDDAECALWGQKWMQFLTAEEQQALLAQAGLFSVNGNIGLYEEGHPLHSVEVLLPTCGASS